MTARRWFISVLAVASLSLALPLASAGAKVPTGGCPAAFVGPLTFQTIIDTWPAPPNVTDPEAHLAAIDFNGDGLLCVRPLNNGTIEANDNVVRTR